MFEDNQSESIENTEPKPANKEFEHAQQSPAATTPSAEADAIKDRGDSLADPKMELLKLIDLALKYPEIGPPLAALAFKVGHKELGQRVVRMGLDQDGPGLEFYFVAAHNARREKRYADARKLSIEAIAAYVRTAEQSLAQDDGERLLHLVRLGFSTMLFDEKDPKCDPDFVEALSEALLELEPRLGKEAFYHALLAQTRWYNDAEASEKAWDQAAEIDPTESTWNARGTWYKDADKDLDRAEQAYRRGLEKAPTSPLLLHNLGQLLVDKSERPDVNLEQARRLLHEAEQLLRGALREESPKGLRRHIHATRDRLVALRASFPPRSGGGAPAEQAQPEREPEVGERLQGRVRSLTAFGAFVVLRGCGTGLLHKSEIAHEYVDDPREVLKVGDELDVKVIEVGRKDGKLRIGLSRKAVLPKPEAPASTSEGKGQKTRAARDSKGSATRQGRREGPQRPASFSNRGRRGQGNVRDGKGGQGAHSHNDDKLASLGEMLLAKINKQKQDS